MNDFGVMHFDVKGVVWRLKGFKIIGDLLILLQIERSAHIEFLFEINDGKLFKYFNIVYL